MLYLLHHPATLNDEQIAEHLAATVKRRSRRWPEFVALEEAHGLDLLPDEPRYAAYHLASTLKLCLFEEYLIEQGWRETPIHSPFSLDRYLPALAFHLSEARLAFLLSDLRRLAEDAAEAEKSGLFVQAMLLTRERRSAPG